MSDKLYVDAADLITCQRCTGTGKWLSMHASTNCVFCDGTGRDPIPFTEIFGVEKARWIHQCYKLDGTKR